MKILGISAFYHDSAAALVINGKIEAAAQEERFTRKKHDLSFPTNAVNFCLNYKKINLKDVDYVIFYEKPFLKFERILETYLSFIPKGFRSFKTSMPLWLKEKIFQKKLIKNFLFKIDNSFNGNNILFTEHHLSHAASCFFPSPFKKSAIITMDGVGEWATTSIAVGEKNKIKIIKEIHFPHSLGLLYSAFTYFLGFKVNSGEYKVMGLAPYGNPKYEKIILDNPNVDSIVLDSGGGLLYEGAELSVLILTNSLNTYTNKGCLSACTIAFISGNRRYISKGARLGFHQYGYYRKQSTIEKLSSFDLQQDDANLFRKRGVSEEFIDMMYQAPPDDMWYPSYGELFKYGLVHEYAD